MANMLVPSVAIVPLSEKIIRIAIARVDEMPSSRSQARAIKRNLEEAGVSLNLMSRWCRSMNYRARVRYVERGFERVESGQNLYVIFSSYDVLFIFQEPNEAQHFLLYWR